MNCVYYSQKSLYYCTVKSLLQNNNIDEKKNISDVSGKLVTVKMSFTYIKQVNKISEKRRRSAKLNGFLCTPPPLAAKIR